MTRWFRFYDDAINDPKVLKLSDKSYRIWTGILCIASKNNGELPSFEDMAILLRMKPEKLQPELETLIKSGLIDHSDLGLIPHNWDKRQFKSDVSTERVKRFRAVSETPPENREQIQKDSEASASGAEAPIDPSKAEREFFSRGREVLGKSAGGQLAKLLKANGGNVSLSRSTLELAATKHNPAEFFARSVAPNAQGPPPGKGGFTSVLMDKHMERQNGTSDS